MKISICVSVHNTEKYLRRCLDSLVEQTVQNKEIIIVNNGSTDSSHAIMLAYKKKYPNIIKIVDQLDLGLAQGRQSAVNQAVGDYIGFVDADDFIDTKMYESMLQLAKLYNADVVECGAYYKGYRLCEKKEGLFNTRELLIEYLTDRTVLKMLWLRIYKRTLFSPEVFPTMYVNNEDNFALPCLLFNSKQTYITQECYYHYTSDNEAAVTKVSEGLKILRNRTKIFESDKFIKEYIGMHMVNSELKKALQLNTVNIIEEFMFCKMDGINAEKRIKAVLEYFEMDMDELKRIFRSPMVTKNKKRRLMKYLPIKYVINIYMCYQKMNFAYDWSRSFRIIGDKNAE